MSSKVLLNQRIQAMEDAVQAARKVTAETQQHLANMVHERNGFAAAVQAMTQQLARQEAAHAETAVLLRQDRDRWREKAARRRRGRLGRAWVAARAWWRGNVADGSDRSDRSDGSDPVLR